MAKELSRYQHDILNHWYALTPRSRKIIRRYAEDHADYMVRAVEHGRGTLSMSEADRYSIEEQRDTQCLDHLLQAVWNNSRATLETWTGVADTRVSTSIDQARNAAQDFIMDAAYARLIDTAPAHVKQTIIGSIPDECAEIQFAIRDVMNDFPRTEFYGLHHESVVMQHGLTGSLLMDNMVQRLLDDMREDVVNGAYAWLASAHTQESMRNMAGTLSTDPHSREVKEYVEEALKAYAGYMGMIVARDNQLFEYDKDMLIARVADKILGTPECEPVNSIESAAPKTSRVKNT